METNKYFFDNQNILEKIYILAGEFEHVSTQEPYCYQSSYKSER